MQYSFRKGLQLVCSLCRGTCDKTSSEVLVTRCAWCSARDLELQMHDSHREKPKPRPPHRRGGLAIVVDLSASAYPIQAQCFAHSAHHWPKRGVGVTGFANVECSLATLPQVSNWKRRSLDSLSDSRKLTLGFFWRSCHGITVGDTSEVHDSPIHSLYSLVGEVFGRSRHRLHTPSMSTKGR